MVYTENVSNRTMLNSNGDVSLASMTDVMNWMRRNWILLTSSVISLIYIAFLVYYMIFKKNSSLFL